MHELLLPVIKHISQFWGAGNLQSACYLSPPNIHVAEGKILLGSLWQRSSGGSSHFCLSTKKSFCGKECTSQHADHCCFAAFPQRKRNNIFFCASGSVWRKRHKRERCILFGNDASRLSAIQTRNVEGFGSVSTGLVQAREKGGCAAGGGGKTAPNQKKLGGYLGVDPASLQPHLNAELDHKTNLSVVQTLDFEEPSRFRESQFFSFGYGSCAELCWNFMMGTWQGTQVQDCGQEFGQTLKSEA